MTHFQPHRSTITTSSPHATALIRSEGPRSIFRRIRLVASAGLLLSWASGGWAWTIGGYGYPELWLDPNDYPDGQLPVELTLFSGFGITPDLEERSVFSRGVPADFLPYLRDLNLDVSVRGSVRTPSGETHVVLRTNANTHTEKATIVQPIGAALIENGWTVIDRSGGSELTGSAILCHDQEGVLLASFFDWSPSELPYTEHWTGVVLSQSRYASAQHSFISCAEEQERYGSQLQTNQYFRPYESVVYGPIQLPAGVAREDSGWSYSPTGTYTLRSEYLNAASIHFLYSHQLSGQGWDEQARHITDETFSSQWLITVPVPAELQRDGLTEADIRLNLRVRALGDGRVELQMTTSNSYRLGSRVRFMDCYEWTPCYEYPVGPNATLWF